MSAATDQPASNSGPVKIHPPNWGLLPHNGELRDNIPDDLIDPRANGNPVFDFEAVFNDLDGPNHPENEMASDGVDRLAMQNAAKAIGAFLDWLLEKSLSHPDALKTIGMRAIAAAWVTNHVRLQGASLTTIGKALGYSGSSRLTRHAAQFSRKFGIKNSYQAHARKIPHETCPDK